MPLPELDEATMRALAKRSLDPLDARIYLLTLYGDPLHRIPPPSTRKERAKLIGKRECVVNLRFIVAEQIMVKVCCEYREANPQTMVVMCNDVPAEGDGLYFGDTITFGHECDTRTDMVERTVVLGHPIDTQDWTPGMGPMKPNKKR